MERENQSTNPRPNTQRFAKLLSLVRRRLRLSSQESGNSSQWVGLGKTLRHYWRVYGGVRALLRSPYLHVSLALTVVCELLITQNVTAYDIALSAIPNLLGFTVGALAIVLAFSSADIFATLAEDGDPRSFFMSMTASLVHFISVQVLALVFGTIAKLTGIWIFDVVTLFLLFYAVLVTFAAGIELFNTAIIYNAHASLRDKRNVRRKNKDKRPI